MSVWCGSDSAALGDNRRGPRAVQRGWIRQLVLNHTGGRTVLLSAWRLGATDAAGTQVVSLQGHLPLERQGEVRLSMLAVQLKAASDVLPGELHASGSHHA
jgi:hypothetical protein